MVISAVYSEQTAELSKLLLNAKSLSFTGLKSVLLLQVLWHNLPEHLSMFLYLPHHN